MPESDLQEKLRQIGEQLKKTKKGSARYRRLMLALDLLLDTEVRPRDLDAEEAWEKGRRP